MNKIEKEQDRMQIKNNLDDSAMSKKCQAFQRNKDAKMSVRET